MKKLGLLFLLSSILAGSAQAGDAPLRIKSCDEGDNCLTLVSTYDGTLKIDHSKIVVNKGSCKLFDFNILAEKAESIKKEALQLLFNNPKVLGSNHYGSWEAKEAAQKEHDRKMANFFKKGLTIDVNEYQANTPDTRVSNLHYGDSVNINVRSNCKNLLLIEIPTNKGVMKFEF